MLFAHLHCKSCYSFLTGASRPADYAKAAAANNIDAVALTDAGGLYGAVAHQKACDHAGVKPVFGVELPVSSDEKEKGMAAEKAVLLARNQRGWSALCQIVTLYATGKNYSLKEFLKSNRDLFTLSSSREFLAEAAEVVPRGLLYGELVVHDSLEPARLLARWADDHQLPVVATNDVYFRDAADQEVAAVLAAMRELKTIGTLAPGDVPSAAAFLASPQEMEKKFRWRTDALANAATIAELCNCRLELGTPRLPRYDLRENVSSIGELRRRCIEGLARRYCDGPSPEALNRLANELRVVSKNGFADYLLMVHDIAREAESRGIRTFGRGSAAASIICYLLQITHVDPVKYNLTFERFMNESRTDMPDIDLDFPWNGRDEMVDYVYQRFGHDKVAMIATHTTFRARGGVREVAKAHGMPEPEINKVTKKIPWVVRTDALEDAVNSIPECADLPVGDEAWQEIFRLARRIDGFPRHISVHPCGLVIAPSRLDNILPLETAAKGLVVTQMDMYPVEDLGLVKMDLLGQRALAVISDTLEVVNQRYYVGEKNKRIEDLVLDPATKKMMRSGQSMGCFYIESPAMRGLLAKLKVEDFEMLTAASSVIRPGPSDSGMMKSFIERHNQREPVRYLHPKMKALLGETYGVMIYQEDVLRVAHEIAGMSLAEADAMRRSMTKKRFHEPIARLQERFLQGAAARGVEKTVAEEIWRQISSFAGYAFCKSHSASFAQVSVQSAHLKVHYPAEFMAAVLTNDGGFYRPGAYVQEARRLGLKILPPYVNYARWGYQGAERSLMVGLMAVKNLCRKTIEKIEKMQPFNDLGDFLARTRPAKDEAEALVACGALDRFGYNRPQLMWIIQKKENLPAAGLLTGVEPAKIKAPPVPDFDLNERMRLEMESLDYTISAHPLSLYENVVRKEKAVFASCFNKFRGKVIPSVAWLVTRKMTRTSRGDYMMFLSMEDTSSAFEAVMFPGVYERFGNQILGQGPYFLLGKVVADSGVLSLNVQELRNIG